MRTKTFFGMISLLILLAPAASFGAEPDYDYTPYLHRFEAFAMVGTGSWNFNDPNGGWMLGGGIVFRPYPKAGFEINIRHLKTALERHYDQDFRSFEQYGQMVTASVHYYFSQQRYQPYVSLGGGYAGSHAKGSYRSGEYEGSYEFDESSFVIEAGSGLDIFLTRQFSIRPDARMLVGSASSIQGSVNLSYHW